MGSWAHLRLGELTLCSSKGDIDPSVMMFFSPTDKKVIVAQAENPEVSSSDHSPNNGDDDEPAVKLEYRAELGIVKDRLELMGFSLGAAKAAFKTGVEEELAENEQRSQQPTWTSSEILSSFLAHKDAILRELTFEDWLDAFAVIVREGLRASRQLWYEEDPASPLPPTVRYLLGGGFDGIWFPSNDFRLFMRAALEVTGTVEEIVYDLTELVAGGYLEVDEDLCGWARRTTADDFTSQHKVIVLTEGHTDKQALEGALKVLYPHLTEYYSFMDFDGAKAPGGAGVLVSTLKAFIGAGVANRIVALFDNDTAARAARRGLREVHIPANVRILHYPPVEWTRLYPTLGPQGLTSMDVNGLAGSLELYFGSDVLRQQDGQLTPIQWRGYDEGMKQYQGEVLHKTELQARFAEKLACCLADPQQINRYDWSGMKAILDCLRTAFHNA